MIGRKIFILLTRFPDKGSKVIALMSRCRYTHASIGLEEDINTFYSFVCKGFITEKITRYLRPEREPFPCRLYELTVTQEVYDTIKDHLLHFEENRSDFQYSRLGLVMRLCHLPYRKEKHYFCSQFVADVLRRCEAVPLMKDGTKYLPGDLRSLPGITLKFRGNLHTLLEHFGVLPIRT